MSEIWDKLIDCEQKIIAKCASLGKENFDDPEFDWLNKVYEGEHFRRAHIDSVDARDSKGLYMTHICVFPNFDNDNICFADLLLNLGYIELLYI